MLSCLPPAQKCTKLIVVQQCQGGGNKSRSNLFRDASSNSFPKSRDSGSYKSRHPPPIRALEKQWFRDFFVFGNAYKRILLSSRIPFPGALFVPHFPFPPKKGSEKGSGQVQRICTKKQEIMLSLVFISGFLLAFFFAKKLGLYFNFGLYFGSFSLRACQHP